MIKGGNNMTKIILKKRGLVEYQDECNSPVVLVIKGGYTYCTTQFEHRKFFLVDDSI